MESTYQDGIQRACRYLHRLENDLKWTPKQKERFRKARAQLRRILDGE